MGKADSGLQIQVGTGPKDREAETALIRKKISNVRDLAMAQRDARHARAAAQPPALPPAQPQQRGNTRSQQPRGSHSGGVEAAAHDADATVDLSVSGACIFRAHECINICEINDCGDNDVLLSNPQPPSRTRRTDGVLCLTLRARGSMRAWFGGEGTRLANARRARGDG